MKPNELIQSIASALLALIAVLGAFLLVIYDTVNNKPIEVPMWVTLMIGAVIGSYFTHNASVNGARQAGTAAAQTAIDRTIGGAGAAIPPSVP